MELVGAAVLVLAVLVVVVASQVGDPSWAFIGLLGYRPPGWPHGVQEDDDARWSWVPTVPPDSDDDPVPTLQPIRPTLGRGRAR